MSTFSSQRENKFSQAFLLLTSPISIDLVELILPLILMSSSLPLCLLLQGMFPTIPIFLFQGSRVKKLHSKSVFGFYTIFSKREESPLRLQFGILQNQLNAYRSHISALLILQASKGNSTWVYYFLIQSFKNRLSINLHCLECPKLALFF